ncbi:amidohydrolase family protein [Sphingomonas sp.]|uniref:amidohydrolase family protein n=1 Tax=Sphingomonas sp. TaxID=28214 RepID=UPI002ED905E5
MRDIPFVDAHVHLWDLGRLRYPWLTPPFAEDGPNGSVAPIARTYLLDDYLAEAAAWRVAGLVHVDAGAHAEDALAETEWLQAMADARGLPNGIVAFAALDGPAVETLLERHAAHGAVRGIRHIVSWHADPARTYTPRDVTGDPAWQRGFGLLARYGLSFDLQAYPGQLAVLAALAARHPETQIIVNHLGMPVDGGVAGRALWVAGMTALAALPNVAVKLSGFGFVARQWSAADARPFVLEVIDMFGTDRCLFASDFPTDRLFAGFDATLDAYATIIAGFSEAERRAMWGRNANRLYRLGLEL